MSRNSNTANSPDQKWASAEEILGHETEAAGTRAHQPHRLSRITEMTSVSSRKSSTSSISTPIPILPGQEGSSSNPDSQKATDTHFFTDRQRVDSPFLQAPNLFQPSNITAQPSDYNVMAGPVPRNSPSPPLIDQTQQNSWFTPKSYVYASPHPGPTAPSPPPAPQRPSVSRPPRHAKPPERQSSWLPTQPALYYSTPYPPADAYRDSQPQNHIPAPHSQPHPRSRSRSRSQSYPYGPGGPILIPPTPSMNMTDAFVASDPFSWQKRKGSAGLTYDDIDVPGEGQLNSNSRWIAPYGAAIPLSYPPPPRRSKHANDSDSDSDDERQAQASPQPPFQAADYAYRRTGSGTHVYRVDQLPGSQHGPPLHPGLSVPPIGRPQTPILNPSPRSSPSSASPPRLPPFQPPIFRPAPYQRPHGAQSPYILPIPSQVDMSYLPQDPYNLYHSMYQPPYPWDTIPPLPPHTRPPPSWFQEGGFYGLPPRYEKYESTSVIFNFITDTLPRQIYLHFLLRLPSLYFSRVARIFEEADLTLPEIKKMALETASANKSANVNAQEFHLSAMYGTNLGGGDPSTLPPQYAKFKSTWEFFIDSVMREWKTFNIVSVLLLSAILTILQIDAAAQDPVTRYTALFSLICALISLLFGCMYIIRFGSMRKTYKAAEWALEAQRTKTVIWWNVWVLLAMPAIWLTWSIVLYIVCIMSFVWRTASSPDGSPTTPTSTLTIQGLLAVRIAITVVLGLGFIYGCLIMATFRRYGDAMDKAWKRRIVGWLQEKRADPSGKWQRQQQSTPYYYPNPNLAHYEPSPYNPPLRTYYGSASMGQPTQTQMQTPMYASRSYVDLGRRRSHSEEADYYYGYNGRSRTNSVPLDQSSTHRPSVPVPPQAHGASEGYPLIIDNIRNVNDPDPQAPRIVPEFSFGSNVGRERERRVRKLERIERKLEREREKEVEDSVPPFSIRSGTYDSNDPHDRMLDRRPILPNSNNIIHIEPAPTPPTVIQRPAAPVIPTPEVPPIQGMSNTAFADPYRGGGRHRGTDAPQGIYPGGNNISTNNNADNTDEYNNNDNGIEGDPHEPRVHFRSPLGSATRSGLGDDLVRRGWGGG